MLEDDADRIDRFTLVLRKIEPAVPLKVWRNALVMRQEIGEHLPSARLISLDHDLEPEPGDPPDIGDGLVVARALVLRPQTCPVIIHSSNRSRAWWMVGEFELAGWSVRRVAPIGEAWIEDYWGAVVRELLGPEVPGRRHRKRSGNLASIPAASAIVDRTDGLLTSE